MTIVVADASALARDVLRWALRGVADVVAAAGSLSELSRLCRQLRPSVVITGTVFPDGQLRGLMQEILLGGARVLVVCELDDADSVAPLLLAGASGCLFACDVGVEELVAAVHSVAEGNAALHPAAAALVLRQWRSANAETPDPGPVRGVPMPTVSLTPRETEVLGALARGLPTKSIGRELEVSPKTIEAHIARLLAKLNARNRAQAVSIAVEGGLLDGMATQR